MNNDPKSFLLNALPPLREVIAAYDLRAQKSLGQNFITDPGITGRIAAAAGDLTGAHVIEIGPGPGGLTRSLCATNAERITAIEFDPRAVAALQGLQNVAPQLEVIQADALHVDWATILDPARPVHIIANLPYNIATVLLVQWLRVMRDRPGVIKQLVLMFQKEVAERLAAPPHNGAYGRLSVMTQWLSEIEIVMTLPPQAFVPPPKVFSNVVRIVPRPFRMDTPPFEIMEKVLHQAFAHRRKMLRSSLKSWTAALSRCGLEPTLRAENLTVDNYTRLARVLMDEELL